MSYILEALKKSDQQRKQEQVPDLNTVPLEPPPAEKKKALWPYLLAGTLLLNIIFFLFVIIRQDLPAIESEAAVHNSDHQQSAIAQEKQQAAIKPQSPQAPPVIQETAPANLVAKVDKKRVTSQEKSNTAPTPEATAVPIIVTESNTEKAENISTSQTDIAREQQEADIEPLLEPVAVTEDTHKKAAQETVPEPATTTPTPTAKKSRSSRKTLSLNQLPPSIQQQLPEIHIAAHVYYQNRPSSRLASINGKLMREGNTLAPDLKVAEISSDGVIFSYKEYFFYVDVF